MTPADRDLIASLDRNHPETMAVVRSEAASKAVAEVLDRLEYRLAELPMWSIHPDYLDRVEATEGMTRPYLWEPNRVRALIASERKP